MINPERRRPPRAGVVGPALAVEARPSAGGGARAAAAAAWSAPAASVGRQTPPGEGVAAPRTDWLTDTAPARARLQRRALF